MNILRKDDDDHIVFMGKQFISFQRVEELMKANEIVQVKHGKWQKLIYNHWLMCSECGFWVNEKNQPIRNYCQNCGAKMDGERREDGETD